MYCAFVNYEKKYFISWNISWSETYIMRLPLEMRIEMLDNYY